MVTNNNNVTTRMGLGLGAPGGGLGQLGLGLGLPSGPGPLGLGHWGHTGPGWATGSATLGLLGLCLGDPNSTVITR